MLKLHLQNSKNYSTQTQVCTRVTKDSSEAELGIMPSLPLAQSPCLVISFSLCPISQQLEESYWQQWRRNRMGGADRKS